MAPHRHAPLFVSSGIAMMYARVTLLTMTLTLGTWVPSRGGTHHVEGHGLHVSAKIVRQMYCGLTPSDPIASLFIDVRVRLRNGSKRVIILARRAGPGLSNRVARSRADTSHGPYVGIMDGYVNDSDAPRVIDGPEPDSRQFVILRPGMSYELDIGTSVVVARSSEEAGVRVLSGARYLLEVDVPLWPFRLDGQDKVRELRDRWSSHGELVSESVPSGFMPFSAPQFGALEQCPASVQGSP